MKNILFQRYVFKRSMVFATACFLFSLAAYSPIVRAEQPRSSTTHDDILFDISKIGRSGSSNQQLSHSKCDKCPEACETVCQNENDRKCLKEIELRRERAFSRCKSQGRL